MQRHTNTRKHAKNMYLKNLEIDCWKWVDWPLCEEVDDLFCWGKGPVGGEEHIDVGGLQLPSVAGQGLHQLLQGPRLHEPHSDRLPLQVGDVVLLVIIHRPGGGVVPDFLEVDRVDPPVDLLLTP